jgi:alpha-L-fucosidase 2
MRELDMDSAIATVSYTAAGVSYRREAFVSAPDNLLVVHMTSTTRRGLHGRIGLSSLLTSTVQPGNGRDLLLCGKAPGHVVPNYESSPQPVVESDVSGDGMFFAVLLRAEHEDGQVTRVGAARMDTADIVSRPICPSPT